MGNACISNSSSTTLSIRQSDAERDKQLLTKFLVTYLSPQADEKRFDWLYLQNPAGRARVWIATLQDNGQIVGVASAFPRRVRYLRKDLQGWVLGDFCVHPDHRSLGPALSLQRQCLKDLAQGAPDFVLDFPSGAMMSVYKRLKVGATDSMVRRAKPLRLDRQILERVPIPALSHLLSVPCNIALHIWDARLLSKNDLTIRLQAAPCGEEFTTAATLWGPKQEISVVRTAEYLNWRFFHHPQVHHEFLTARRHGELVGYLVVRQEGQDAAIVDMSAREEPSHGALLFEAMSIFRNRGVQTLSFSLLRSSPINALLGSYGFHPRESHPVVLIAPAGWDSDMGGCHTDSWHLTDGDRES